MANGMKITENDPMCLTRCVHDCGFQKTHKLKSKIKKGKRSTMGDIRGFFGGPKGAPPSQFKESPAKVVESSPVLSKSPEADRTEGVLPGKASRRKLVIEDDDDDDDKQSLSAKKEAVAAVRSPVKENVPNVEKSVPPLASKKATSVAPSLGTTSQKADKKPETSSAKATAAALVKGDITNTTMKESMSTDLPKELESLVTWKAGEKVPYAAVVDCFERVSAVSGRLEKENLLARLFRAIILTSPSELEAVVYLVSNSVAPNFEGLELGIGDSLLVKAICSATGRTKDAVDVAYKEEGDLGVVALTSRASQKTLSFAAKPKPLLAAEVLEQFRVITRTKGDKAQARKIDIIKALMIKGIGAEAKYIVRALQGKLRIGTAAQTVLVSLATAFAKSIPPAVSQQMLQDSNSLEVEEEEEEEGEEEEGETAAAAAAAADTGKSASNSSDAGKASAAGDEMRIDSTGNSLSVHDLHSAVVEKQPQEARKLQAGTAGVSKSAARLKEEERVELSVIAVKRAFSECPSLTLLVKALLTSPIYALYRTCRLVPGLPVAPMLAKPTKAIGEVLRRLAGQAFTMEYKYDGERAQVHLLEDGTVRIFSRNSLDDTERYPDLAQCIHTAKVAGITSCVIDAEVVAWDREKACILPFQVLSTRKRKVEEGDEDNQKVKVVLQGFDMLYINGKSLLQESLRNRRRMLHAAFTHTEAYFHFASGMDHVEDGDTCVIETYLQEACGAMCEGLMVKTLDDNATYEPSKRSLNWLKLKKDYIEGMGVCDSVDLVVIGAYHGRGKRTNVYGAYLMACYDPDHDEYQSVCKVGTGFKEVDLVRFSEQMKAHVTANHRKPFNYKCGDALEPDDWFDAHVVWELQAADLSKSSVHKGGIGKLDPDRGIGLRFPRFIRERTDKKPENATNADQIVDMYNSQDLTGLDEKAAGNDEDDEDAL
jgi:DNA ligase-1